MMFISGGQDGADLGALYGARDCGLKTGGTAPYNWFSGGKPEEKLLRSFGLVAGPYDPKIYPKRSMLNVDNSDGTIAVLWGDSVGTMKTIGYAQTKKWKFGELKEKEEYYRPLCVIQEHRIDLIDVSLLVEHFFLKYNIKVCNFAGHREKSQPGIFEFSRNLIIRINLYLTGQY